MVDYRGEVDGLLKSYAKYKELLKVQSELSTIRAKQKIAGSVDAKLENDYETNKKNLQHVSDSMTFSNPFVWIMYKFEAYQNEAQPICTMRDFRIHCSKAGYICTKRFSFVNERLAQKGRPTLMEDFYNDEMPLYKLLMDESMQELMNDSMFVRLWHLYEYNTVDERVAKWENYAFTSNA